MLVDTKKVLVEIVIATLHIIFLQFSTALNCGSPSDHEIVRKLFALFRREFIVKVSILEIQLSHLISNV
jgi:hypothetical protein